MPQITDQTRLLRDYKLVLAADREDGMLGGQYIRCPNCGDYVSKGAGYDECSCGNIFVDSDMLRVSVRDPMTSRLECYEAIPINPKRKK